MTSAQAMRVVAVERQAQALDAHRCGMATSRLNSSRSVRPAWTRPRESSSAMHRVDPLGADRPSCSSARRSRRAMPMPAAPAPASTKRRSADVAPELPRRGIDAGHRDRGRALDVVVEAGHAVAEVVQDAQRVGSLEVLPLDDAAGPDLLDALHEGLDELVVGRAAQPAGAVAHVERVVEQGAVVGAHVERDRQRQRGVQAAAGGVQRQLADGDAHAAGALVAQAQDALVVGDDDEAHVLDRASCAAASGCGRCRRA